MTPSYALGLFFILCVSLIWAAASVLVQHLYRDMNFDSPFLLTYISTGLFILWLPTRLIWERRGKMKRFTCRLLKRICKVLGVNRSDGTYEEAATAECDTEDVDGDGRDVIIPWRNDPSIHGPISTIALNDDPSDRDDGDEGGSIEMEQRGPYQSLAAQPSAASTSRSEDEKDEDENDENNVNERDGNCKGMTLPRRADKCHNGTSSPQQNGTLPHSVILSHVDHIGIAIRIAPVWFLSNYFYNTSLAYTSITSSTVLASTGSLFTFLFAVSCGDERFTTYKLLGVLLCFIGSVLTGLSDVETDTVTLADTTDQSDMARILDGIKPTAALSTEATRTILSQAGGDSDDGGAMAGGLILGDLAGLISAMGYGTYTVLIRSLCPRDEDKYSMQLLLGYIGVINGIGLLPIALKVAFWGDCHGGDNDGVPGGEPHPLAFDISSSCEKISALVLMYLIGKALADNVLSDYLWARAVVLTSATVATVGLGLTIPLAFASDWLLGRASVTSTESIVGAVSVLAGFLFVNCGEVGSCVVSSSEDVRDVVDTDEGSAVPIS